MTDLTIVDNAFNTAGEAGEAALDTVVGGAAMAFDTATRPRRTVGRARRRGSEVNEVIAEVTEEAVDGVLGLPERALVGYVRMLRRQAKRDDLVGAASRTLLGTVHGRAREAARFFTRIERETDVDAQGRRRTAAAGTPRRRTGTRQTTRTGATTRRTGGTRRTATRRTTTTRARRTA
jgi:hypothetical protein